jgi:hypothetical protein
MTSPPSFCVATLPYTRLRTVGYSGLTFLEANRPGNAYSQRNKKKYSASVS